MVLVKALSRSKTHWANEIASKAQEQVLFFYQKTVSKPEVKKYLNTWAAKMKAEQRSNRETRLAIVGDPSKWEKLFQMIPLEGSNESKPRNMELKVWQLLMILAEVVPRKMILWWWHGTTKGGFKVLVSDPKEPSDFSSWIRPSIMVGIYNKHEKLRQELHQVVEKGVWKDLDDFLDQEQKRLNEDSSK